MKPGKHAHSDLSSRGRHSEFGPHGSGLQGESGSACTAAKTAKFRVIRDEREKPNRTSSQDKGFDNDGGTYVAGNIERKDRPFVREDKRKSDCDSLRDTKRLSRSFLDKDSRISDYYKPHSAGNPC